MTAPVTFKFTSVLTDPGALGGMIARLQDLTAAFEDIVAEWAAGNVDKFAGAVGAELAGYAPDADVYWPEVTAQYYREKHGPVDARWYQARGLTPRRLYEDHLMVKTGNLRDTLTHPDQFAQAILPKTAVFGTPLDEDAQAALEGNLASRGRQVVFLGELDRDHIASTITQFIYGRGKYASDGTPPNPAADVAATLDFPGGA